MSPKTFKASTAKQVLSQISRELGSDAIIISHGKTQDSEGRPLVEATASPRAEVATPTRTLLTSEETTAKFSIKKLFLPALVILVLIIAGVLIWQLLLRNTPANPFSQNLSVAIISFENQTGDDSYDYLNKVIPNLLITSLEQSGYFQVASWERLHDLLKQIGKEDVEVIDKDLGFELCQMDDIETLVIGSFAKAGDMFVTDVKVLDVETKRILKGANSRGKGEKSIIQSQIDELSREISQGIGISENKLERAPFRIADITTNSLDAYYYFLRGNESYINEKVKDSRKFLEKAIELDPSFAMAHLYLGRALWNLGEDTASDEAYKKAKNFSTRATEKERLYIDGCHAFRVENDLEKGFRIFKNMVKRYPKEKKSHEGLAIIYFAKELFDLAIEEYNKELELDPDNARTFQSIAFSYYRLGDYEKAIEYIKKQISVSLGDHIALRMWATIYLEMGKLDEALAKYKEALEVDQDVGMDWKISYIHALKEDYPEAMRWIDRYLNNVVNPHFRIWGYFIKSLYHYWLGNLDKSMSNILKQTEFADKTAQTHPFRSKKARANASWMMGWISYDQEEYESCRKHFKTWFDLHMQVLLRHMYINVAAYKTNWTTFYSFYLGLVDLKQGKIESAKSRLVEIDSLLPEVLPRFKNWVSFYHDYLQAEILLADGSIEKAITISENLSPLAVTCAVPLLVLYNAPFLKDVLARAYRQNGEIDQAIAEYERLTTFDPQRKERHLIHPKYYYRIAELYEQKGMKGKAIEHYQKFLNLWKNADPDILEVIEAKKRLSELQNEPMTVEQR
jgi:tetratricopeptide (TPR) repeat protein